jgi:hypothetical protein
VVELPATTLLFQPALALFPGPGQNQLSFKLLTIFNLKEYTQNETRVLIQVFSLCRLLNSLPKERPTSPYVVIPMNYLENGA